MAYKTVHTFHKGMNRDIAKESYGNTAYFDARNIKIGATDKQATLAISNEQGTELEVTINEITSVVDNGTTVTVTPGVSGATANPVVINDSGEMQTLISNVPAQGTHKIIGSVVLNDYLILFTTDDKGIDIIWRLSENNDVWIADIVYINDLGFSSSKPLEIIVNYENDNIQKVYWVDEVNQLRNINISPNDTNTINKHSTQLDSIPAISFGQPTLVSTSTGGSHTSGMIQYAYSLYTLSGSESKISPLSELIPLDKGIRGGGELNELVGQINTINIDPVDQRYDYIKVYAIKYTSYEEEPSIGVIADLAIGSNSVDISDDGRILSTVSLEEFVFLGGEPIIPKTITSKDNRLFAGNFQIPTFDVDFDTRAYRWSTGGTAVITDNDAANITFNNPGELDTIPVAEDYDCIQTDFKVYKYQSDGSTIGGEGKNVSFRIVPKTAIEVSGAGYQVEDLRFLKSREYYRLGIEFYNELGQVSPPKWVCDFRTPMGNLSDQYQTLEVTIDPTQIANLQSQGVVGWRIIRAERKPQDRTILTQGMVQPTVFQVLKPTAESLPDNTDQPNLVGDYVNTVTNNLRTLDTYTENIVTFPYDLSIKEIVNGGIVSISRPTSSDDNTPHLEIYTDLIARPDQVFQKTYVNTRLWQFHSPEITFNENLNFSAGDFYVVLGAYNGQENQSTGKRVIVDSRVVDINTTNISGLSLYTETDHRSTNTLHVGGMIADSGQAGKMNFHQYYRRFWNDGGDIGTKDPFDFNGSTSITAPLIVDTGNEQVTYNGNDDYRFLNALTSFTSDDHYFKNNFNPLNGVNTYGTKSAILVSTAGSTLESTYSFGGYTTGLPIMEIQRFLNSQYGGNSFEARKNTVYLKIGEYTDIATDTISIFNAGDVYVQNYRFLRLSSVPVEIFDSSYTQQVEIVEFPIETTIDLKNRADQSLNKWDSKFQPLDDDYHKYNYVYSQEGNLITSTDVPANFREVIEFNISIIATKVKTPNEIIDSWTDVLLNEQLQLDGKHGSITELVNFNDEVYSFQEKAISHIAINPRVQTVGDDGVSIELGTGNVLHDYGYITTTSGCKNKFSVSVLPSAIYYFDLDSLLISRIAGGKYEGLSDIHGFHVYMRDNIIYEDMDNEDIFSGNGVISGYDSKNDTVYMSFKQSSGSDFTLAFDERFNAFTSFYDFVPSDYIDYKSNLYSIPTNNELWHHDKGSYSEYYGTKYPVSITLLSNPNTSDNIFNNLGFRTEVYEASNDVWDETFSEIEIWNDYQTSGSVDLTHPDNIKRKFRDWGLIIPREENSRNRIRGPWAFIKLTFDHPENYKFISHNIELYHDALQ